MRYSVPFESIEGHRWGLFATAFQVEFAEFAAFAVRELHLQVRYDDANEHNARIWLARGLGGTATREIPSAWVPKGDSEQRDAPFVVRSGFRVEPLSAPGDMLQVVAVPSGRTFGPLRFGKNELIIAAGAGLRVLAASEDEWAPVLSGTVKAEVIR